MIFFPPEIIKTYGFLILRRSLVENGMVSDIYGQQPENLLVFNRFHKAYGLENSRMGVDLVFLYLTLNMYLLTEWQILC